MRINFTKAIHSVLAADSKAVFITGDLGYNALEDLRSGYPERFLNAGVAEQNMVGMAAGMALAGFRPWVYSIAPFAVYRCFEQIRNDVCLHNLTVRIVGNGGGYTYGIMGSTHHALEDLGVLKTLPNMQLFFPCTNAHVEHVVAEMQRTEGPAYLRLSISGFSQEQEPLSETPISLTRHYTHGTKLTVVAVGHALQLALTALGMWPHSHRVDVFGVARFPFDAAANTALIKSVERTQCVLLIDEHYEFGSIAESLRGKLCAAKTVMMCAHYLRGQKYGSSRFHQQQAQLDPQHIVATLERMIGSLPQEGQA